MSTGTWACRSAVHRHFLSRLYAVLGKSSASSGCSPSAVPGVTRSHRSVLSDRISPTVAGRSSPSAIRSSTAPSSYVTSRTVRYRAEIVVLDVVLGVRLLRRHLEVVQRLRPVRDRRHHRSSEVGVRRARAVRHRVRLDHPGPVSQTRTETRPAGTPSSAGQARPPATSSPCGSPG